MDPYQLTAAQVVQQIRSNQLTVENYARSLLARIDARDGDVHAWAYLNHELVLNQARQLDQVPLDQRGPLHGVAVGVKDVIYTKGIPATSSIPN